MTQNEATDNSNASPLVTRCDTGEPPVLRPLILCGEGDPASDPGLVGGSPVAQSAGSRRGGLTVEEFRRKVAEDAAKPKPPTPDPFEDWGDEIDKHPIQNPTRGIAAGDSQS